MRKESQAQSPNLILTGFMGSGKSAVGRRIAAWTGMPFIDLDAEIVARAGLPIAELFERFGEADFRCREYAALCAVLARPGQVIATGGGIVTDPRSLEQLRGGGIVVRLRVSVDEVLRRVGEDRSRPLLNVPDRRARVAALLESRAAAYEALDWMVETDGRTEEAVAREVLAGYRTRTCK